MAQPIGYGTAPLPRLGHRELHSCYVDLFRVSSGVVTPHFPDDLFGVTLEMNSSLDTKTVDYRLVTAEGRKHEADDYDISAISGSL